MKNGADSVLRTASSGINDTTTKWWNTKRRWIRGRERKDVLLVNQQHLFHQLGEGRSPAFKLSIVPVRRVRVLADLTHQDK